VINPAIEGVWGRWKTDGGRRRGGRGTVSTAGGRGRRAGPEGQSCWRVEVEEEVAEEEMTTGASGARLKKTLRSRTV
jgi:hypothetical protein